MINGYTLAEEMFVKISENENHEISIEDALKIISFWGFNEEAIKTSKLGFVCCCAREKIKKIFEQTLIYGDFSLYKELETEINKIKREVNI